jgi:hypothetical protein
MKRIMVIALVALLTGCAAHKPSGTELDSADYGAYPNDYKHTIDILLRAKLKDPDSAKITFLTEPRKGWEGRQSIKYGWAVCVGVNARNSDGGYSGDKIYYFLLRGETLASSIFPTGGYDGAARDACMDPVRKQNNPSR